MGLSGAVDSGGEVGVQVLAGNLDLMKLYNVEVGEEEISILHEWASLGKTVVFIATNGQVCFFASFNIMGIENPIERHCSLAMHAVIH